MKKLLGLIVILILGIQFLFAGVISVKDAAKLVKKDKAVLVSTRPADDYSKKHIKGAVHIDLDELYNAEGIKTMLKPAEDIAKIFSEKGLSTDKKIIIYCNTGTMAGRLYWILEYLGAKDVDILDGHIKGWMKARKPITKKATKIKAAEFKPAVDDSKIATMDYVKSNLKNDKVLIVDVRNDDEFAGKEKDNENITRKGHIPGAIHLEHKKIINDDNTIKSKEEIAKLLKAVGISSDKEIILYCASSVRAGIVYAALTSIMEFPNVKVYDGAYWEWNVNKDNPIE